MKTLGRLVIFAVLQAGTVCAAGLTGIHNVRDYGAVGDGETLDHHAINRTIEACSGKGGGTVHFPAGTYLCGSIRLQSNITLHLDNGATIKGADNKLGVYDHWDENPWPYQDFGHSHWKCSLIWGIGLTNIAIEGKGTIDGGGMTRDDPGKPGEGDKAIGLKLCRNITIRDVSIVHGGHFAILPTGCDNMTIDGVKVDTNRDGINLDCCRNVRVSNCSINSPFDDGICLKSSYALGFRRATENVTIVNCLVSGYPEGTLMDGTYLRAKTRNEGCGGIKCGTESNGGFKNITVSNCVLDKSAGLSLEIVDGGVMESINISDIVMRDVTSAPIFIRLGDRRRGPEDTGVGTIRDVRISNIAVNGSWDGGASSITGIPDHPVEDIRVSNVRILCDGGASEEDARRPVPYRQRDYPRSDMFGKLPASGFYCRHVDDLVFHDVDVRWKKDDLRPAMMCEAVNGLEIDNLRFRAAEGAPFDPLRLLKVRNAVVRNCRGLNGEAFDPEDAKVKAVSPEEGPVK